MLSPPGWPLDTTLIAGAAVLLLTAVLLLLISGAEAAIGAISRSRVRDARANGPTRLLNGYIRQRHELLRTLSTAAASTIVVGTAAATLLVLRGREVGIAGAAVVVVLATLAALLLRQSARTVALVNPEAIGARLALPIRSLHLLFAPLAWLADAPARALLRGFGSGSAPAAVDLSGELLALIDPAADVDGAAELAEERRMMRGIMAMSGQTVREVMSPRTDLVATSTDASIGDVMKLVIDSGFTRIPIYEQSVDRIVGVVYAKDLLAYLQAGEMQPELRAIARPPYFVPEAKRANELLAEMRRDQVHMAIAVDEYGGTAGVITVEDLVEEIVGEIVDEYDTEEAEVERVSDDEAIVDAGLPLDELNEVFGIEVDSEDFDTVGGLVLSLLGRLAAPGDEAASEEHGLELRVLTVDGRRIKRVRVTRTAPADVAEEESAAAL